MKLEFAHTHTHIHWHLYTLTSKREIIMHYRFWDVFCFFCPHKQTGARSDWWASSTTVPDVWRGEVKCFCFPPLLITTPSMWILPPAAGCVIATEMVAHRKAGTAMVTPISGTGSARPRDETRKRLSCAFDTSTPLRAMLKVVAWRYPRRQLIQRVVAPFTSLLPEPCTPFH